MIPLRDKSGLQNQICPFFVSNTEVKWVNCHVISKKNSSLLAGDC